MKNAELKEIFRNYFLAQMNMYADEMKRVDGCWMLSSKYVDDGMYNFLFDMECKSVEDFEKILTANKKLFGKRKPRFYILETKENAKFLPKLFQKFDIFDADTWFCTNLCDMKIPGNKNKNVVVDVCDDKDVVIPLVKNGFSTGDKNDPYGLVSDCYWKELEMNFGKKQNGFETIHFVARLDGMPAGVASAVVNGALAYLNNLAVLKEFRKQGVSKAIIDKMNEILTAKGVRYGVFLTAKDGYPAKIYKKIGYKPLCNGYCFECKKNAGN